MSWWDCLAGCWPRSCRWSHERVSAPLVFDSCIVRRICSSSGLNYKLIISLPHSYNHPEASRESYPVVYALDAEPYLFPLLAVVARTEHFFKRSTWFPDLIIVGITADLEKDCQNSSGINVKKLWDELRPTRARDYLPTSAESPWGAPGASSLKDVSGHASTFCDFLSSMVVPYVDHHFRTTKQGRALIGKSFGGSGVAHAMLDAGCSRCFQYFLLGSPSLAWDNKAFFRLEEEHHRTLTPLEACVYASCGSKEESQKQLLQDFRSVLESRCYPNLSITLEVVEGRTLF
ncbi:unnamed protein product [Durusdinium trenchii]|uniref:Esterase n=1 Tax=Durusdinium trenchii TaxID=1381693 RepID=A0ABP0SG22_9DINO